MCMKYIPFPMFPKFFALWVDVFRGVEVYLVVNGFLSGNIRYIKYHIQWVSHPNNCILIYYKIGI